MRKAEGKEVGSGVCNPSPELRLCISQAANFFIFGRGSRGEQKLMGRELLSSSQLDLTIFYFLGVVVEAGKLISKFQVVFILGYYGEISRGLYQLVATSLPPIIHFNRCLICNDTKEIY